MRGFYKRAVIISIVSSAMVMGNAFLVPAWAFEREEEVEKYLGLARKQQMEQEAREAAQKGQESIFWLAPLDANGQTISGPNGGIPSDSVFYSSTDQVWQPLRETTAYLSSVHQIGEKTGTAYISWNNGRGNLFAYTADEYEEITDQVSYFKEQYIRDDMTDFEKEMQIIQYLVANTVYPYERYLAGLDTREDHNAYGALIRGEAVCEGYAEAFCWLADACGLENRFIYGVYDGEMHDWNMVKLDGQWYQLDITSDDTTERNGVKNGYGWGNLRNKYINLTDETMRQDHQWQPLKDISCQAQTYGQAAVGEYLKTEKGAQ